ncbi:uncharacterized protein LOC62_02G002158 [Vanrija pseudolonga]|uniref:Uncharacterized protein n=1 Tax=Vanrija pseudolonga TaxID=143232 RepID=A0AAF1BJP5_9TREE|nr:hypothetical protein LOC62_02G002158 [Vanrija pseudolonga]
MAPPGAAAAAQLLIIDLCDPEAGSKDHSPPSASCALCGSAIGGCGWLGDWHALGLSARVGHLDSDGPVVRHHSTAVHDYCLGIVQEIAGAERRVVLLALAIPLWAARRPLPVISVADARHLADPREPGQPTPLPAPAIVARAAQHGFAGLPEPVLHRIVHFLVAAGTLADLQAMQGTCSALRALPLGGGVCTAAGLGAAMAFSDRLARTWGWASPAFDGELVRPLAEAFARGRTDAAARDTLRWWLCSPGWRARRRVWAAVVACAAAARDTPW